MRRPRLAAALLMLAAAVIAPSAVAAQDDAAGSGADHPIVGAWLVQTDPTCECPPDQVVVLGPGGTLVDWSPGSAGYGAWSPTGDRTADVTFLQPQADGEGGFAGFVTVRSSVEVAADGQSFAGTFTIELPEAMAQALGMQPGEYGPGTVTGERIGVTPMGTPVAPLPQEQPGPAESPAASPAD